MTSESMVNSNHDQSADKRLIKYGLIQVVIPILMATINIVNEIGCAEGISRNKIFTTWITSSILLYLIWKWNEFLFNNFNSPSIRSRLQIAIYNLTLIAALSFVLILLFEPRWSQWMLIVRVSVGTLLMVFIQNALNSYRTAQAFKVLNARLQMENSEARIAALENQINPHFLFNALATLRSMVRSKDTDTEKFILNLSDVYRQLLSTKKTLVFLKEELDFLESYLFMLTSRFEEALKIKIEFSERAEKMRLPFLSLQLLIENCLKHNIVSSQKPLEIHVFQTDSQHISVSNTLNLKNSEGLSLGSGLMNLKNRYALLGHNDGVSIKNSGDYYMVTLKLLE